MQHKYSVVYDKYMVTGLFTGWTIDHQVIPFPTLDQAEDVASSLFASGRNNQIRSDCTNNKFIFRNVHIEPMLCSITN